MNKLAKLTAIFTVLIAAVSCATTQSAADTKVQEQAADAASQETAAIHSSAMQAADTQTAVSQAPAQAADQQPAAGTDETAALIAEPSAPVQSDTVLAVPEEPALTDLPQPPEPEEPEVTDLTQEELAYGYSLPFEEPEVIELMPEPELIAEQDMTVPAATAVSEPQAASSDAPRAAAQTAAEPDLKPAAVSAQAGTTGTAAGTAAPAKPAQTPKKPEKKVNIAELTSQTSAAADTATAEQQEPQADAEENILAKYPPSRTAAVQKNQYLDVSYPGSGWVYLGELKQADSQEDTCTLMEYLPGQKETLFILRPLRQGAGLLHFYKNDPLTGTYIDDYLAVQITAANADGTAKDAGTAETAAHIRAPAYAEAVPARPAPAAGRQAANSAPAVTVRPAARTVATESAQPAAASTGTSTSTGTAAGSVPAVSSLPAAGNTVSAAEETPAAAQPAAAEAVPRSAGLKAAYESFNAKNYEQALQQVNDSLLENGTETDYALYLRGQILEQRSPVRNIKQAIESYEKVVSDWPASPYWQKSNERSKYLRRFYINIQ